MKPMLDSLLDLANVMLCVYIVLVGIIRLSMMSWATHRRPWLVIYALLVLSAAWSLGTLAEGAPHWRLAPFFGYLATALWFHESRERWRDAPPVYMLRDPPQ